MFLFKSVSGILQSFRPVYIETRSGSTEVSNGKNL
jgi:hypothetical protein